MIMETKKAEFDKKTRGQSFNYKIIGTRKYQISFTTTKFKELVTQYFDLKNKYK